MIISLLKGRKPGFFKKFCFRYWGNRWLEFHFLLNSSDQVVYLLCFLWKRYSLYCSPSVQYVQMLCIIIIYLEKKYNDCCLFKIWFERFIFNHWYVDLCWIQLYEKVLQLYWAESFGDVYFGVNSNDYALGSETILTCIDMHMALMNYKECFSWINKKCLKYM